MMRNGKAFLAVYVVSLVLTFCLGFAVCWFSPGVGALLDWRDQTREAVYGSLDESRQALDEFLASGDPAQLERSRQSIGDLLERVEQCGDYTGFLTREDNVGALVLGACTDFLDSAGRYMDRLDPAQLTQAQRQTLQDILGTLTDEDGGPTQFGTIYFQLLPAFPNGVVS